DRRATGPTLAAVLASPHLAGLTDLDLFGVWLRNTGALADARQLTRLARLELSDARGGDHRLAGLLRSPGVGGLAYLGLEGNALREAGVRALAASHRLAGLATLDLSTNRVGAAGLLALASSPHLGRLRGLDLSRASLAPPAARALGQATGLAGL